MKKVFENLSIIELEEKVNKWKATSVLLRVQRWYYDSVKKQAVIIFD